MKMNNDFTKILKKIHENKWVAFNPSKTKIVDYSENLVDLNKKVGDKDVVFMKVPPSNSVYAF